jgi:NAD(P)-dependent dehydrogenase (short-subunit alcohol dehydrogenase family)
VPGFVGRRVVVTGGSSGNGRAIALAFAREGAEVVVADLTPEPREGGTATHREIERRYGVRAAFVPCDVRSPAELASAVALAEAWGGLDVLVANAGVLRRRPLVDLTPEEIDLLLGINLTGVVLSAQAAARAMLPRGRGVIVLMASVAALRGTGGYALYNASKGAVRMLVSSLADELGPAGLRVVGVAPGIIDTLMNRSDDPLIGTPEGERYRELIPVRRYGSADEVAEAVVYLAGDGASYVTGTTLVVDGGYLRI